MNSIQVFVTLAVFLGISFADGNGRLWYAGDPDLSARNDHRLANVEHKVCQRMTIINPDIGGVEIWGKRVSNLIISFRDSIDHEVANYTVKRNRFVDCGQNGEYIRYQAVFEDSIRVIPNHWIVCFHWSKIDVDERKYYVVAKVGDDENNAVGLDNDPSGSILYNDFEYSVTKNSAVGLWGIGIDMDDDLEADCNAGYSDPTECDVEGIWNDGYYDVVDCLQPGSGQKICYTLTDMFEGIDDDTEVTSLNCFTSECLEGEWDDISACREVLDDSCIVDTDTNTVCFSRYACPDQIDGRGSRCIRNYDVSFTTTGCKYGPHHAKILVPASTESVLGELLNYCAPTSTVYKNVY